MATAMATLTAGVGMATNATAGLLVEQVEEHTVESGEVDGV